MFKHVRCFQPFSPSVPLSTLPAPQCSPSVSMLASSASPSRSAPHFPAVGSVPWRLTCSCCFSGQFPRSLGFQRPPLSRRSEEQGPHYAYSPSVLPAGSLSYPSAEGNSSHLWLSPCGALCPTFENCSLPAPGGLVGQV